MSKRILIVDDESSIRQALKRLLDDLGYQTVCVPDGAAAIDLLNTEPFDLCITDLLMPGPDGLAVLAAARAHISPIPTVVITGQGTARDAVAALRAGAFDFIAKPFHATSVETCVKRYLDSGSRQSSFQATHGAALIGEHPALRLALERIDQVAESRANVLIRGAEGTGKEVVARLIHASSDRRAGPFVSINLAAVPAPLAESELFGHLKGAFAGADRPRAGKILAAQNGSLFLDEITAMTPGVQEKFLAILTEQKVTPLGSQKPVPADVRIIASTTKDLATLVRDGSFRSDLFYKLAVIPIELPALEDRPDDIPLLSEHFRREMNARHGRTVSGFSAGVMDRLRASPWPGNVRQLQGVIERVVISASNREIAIDDLPPNLRTTALDLAQTPLDLPPCGVDLRGLLSQLEDRLIGQALERTNGNRNRAAELLGLNRTTLVEKLRRRKVA